KFKQAPKTNQHYCSLAIPCSLTKARRRQKMVHCIKVVQETQKAGKKLSFLPAFFVIPDARK
ncbi:MAG: hypothetical protein PHD32_09195, partial [Eubacteriales bacterium]|nr:hypothetical protein [Eubacteriales bacterium]